MLEHAVALPSWTTCTQSLKRAIDGTNSKDWIRRSICAQCGQASQSGAGVLYSFHKGRIKFKTPLSHVRIHGPQYPGGRGKAIARSRITPPPLTFLGDA